MEKLEKEHFLRKGRKCSFYLNPGLPKYGGGWLKIVSVCRMFFMHGQA